MGADELREITVQNLMNEEQNGWEYDILNDICNTRDKELITRIPISLRQGDDSWFWLLEKDGRFTLKSCYQTLQGVQRCEYTKFWNCLWSLQLPGKIIVFLWRVCKRCLPTTQALSSRKVEIIDECPWCRMSGKTDRHVLFDYDFARTTWVGTGLHHLIQPAGEERAFDVLCKAYASATRDQCVQIGMLCWSLWNRRNKWVWERANGSIFGVKVAAVKLLEDWKEARRIEVRENKHKGESRRKWCKPPKGWVKMNVDAAIFQNGSIGLGCVLRDEHGSLKEALIWAKANGVHHCIVETDSQVLANACEGLQNNVAHVLAKAALPESGLGEWMFTPPDFIDHVIDYDIF